jgi:hypothetical protein
MPGARRVPVAGVVQAALQALEELSDAGERRERESAAEAKQLTRVLAEPEVEAAARKNKDRGAPAIRPGWRVRRGQERKGADGVARAGARGADEGAGRAQDAPALTGVVSTELPDVR